MSDAATTETDARELKISEQADVIAELIKVIEQLKEQNTQFGEQAKRLEAGLAAKIDAKSSKKPVFTFVEHPEVEPTHNRFADSLATRPPE